MNQDVYPIFVSYSKNILSQKNYVPGLHGVAWFKIFVFTAIIRYSNWATRATAIISRILIQNLDAQ